MAYVLHRTPCCRSIWESRHNKKDLPVGIPNNVIKYTASEKLPEISSGYNGGGIDTRFFDVSIVNHTFENGVGTIEFDGDITIIKNGSSGPPMGAFYNCSNLTSVEIPNSVTSIGSYAFYNCFGLPLVIIPNSVTSIGESAFSSCSSLTSVTIPNSVTSIGNSAFSGCSGLTSMIVSSGNLKYDSRNNCNAIIETATNKLISGCKNTVIPNSVTSIGAWAFGYCIGLTSIEIPNSVTSISEQAFSYCSGLTSIEIPNSVTSISEQAFSGCSGLTSVTIPNSVTSIGQSAFYGCSGLTSITCNATTAPTIQSNTFRNVKTGGTLYVPSGSSGYSTWMGTGNYYLGKYNWSKVEQ